MPRVFGMIDGWNGIRLPRSMRKILNIEGNFYSFIFFPGIFSIVRSNSCLREESPILDSIHEAVRDYSSKLFEIPPRLEEDVQGMVNPIDRFRSSRIFDPRLFSKQGGKRGSHVRRRGDGSRADSLIS